MVRIRSREARNMALYLTSCVSMRCKVSRVHRERWRERWREVWKEGGREGKGGKWERKGEGTTTLKKQLNKSFFTP